MGVRNVISHSLWICWKDLLEFSRSKLRLVMLVLMPLFMMVMVGFIFPTGSTITDTPIALVNNDAGSMGTSFVAQLNAINNKSGMMLLSSATDFNDIKTKLQNNDIHGGLIIPENFSSDILSGKQGYITIVIDQSNPQMSLTMQGVITKTIEAMGKQSAISNLNSSYHVSVTTATSLITPYIVESKGIVPGEPNYFQFVAPGIIAMVVMMALMTGLPHAISYEKDMGTLDGMLAAPINRLSIILGKVTAQTVRGMIQGFIILLLAVVLFGVVIQGSILLVILLILLTVFSFVGLGILITSFTENEETATMVMMTLMFPMMFLSGVFFPLQQMPWYMQGLAKFLPLTYATTALRKVMVLGADISAVGTEVLILVAFGIVLLAVAVPMFRRAMSK
ncbi:MAG TPA: ABC transporter permease [Thermoplasmata archaeon]|jgi:ABC-2 type transport system permease protein|nr:MAG TPA: ABC transporter permease [Thermoplasmata archaeon]